MIKRFALALLLVAGCTPQGTPTVPASPGAPAATASAAPFHLTTYDGGDFQIGVPTGWTQIAKDQPLAKSTNRCTFRLDGQDGKPLATLIVTSSSSPGAKLADQFALLKAATLQQGETITAESRTETGEPFGLRSTLTSADGTTVNYRFVAVGDPHLYLIGLSGRQGGPLTDEQALRIIESFLLP